MTVVSALLGTAPVASAMALLATVDPEDGLRPDLEPTDVTPGVVGFAVTAVVVVGLIGLILSMVVKLRRVNLGTERPAPPWASDGGAPDDGASDGGSGGASDLGSGGGASGGGASGGRPGPDGHPGPGGRPGPDGRDR